MEQSLITLNESADISLDGITRIGRSITLFVLFPIFVTVDSRIYKDLDRFYNYAHSLYTISLVDKYMFSPPINTFIRLLDDIRNEYVSIILNNREKASKILNIYIFAYYFFIMIILWCIFR